MTTKTAPPPSPGGPSGPLDPLLFALRGLHRAYHKSSIYPEGHPSIPAAVREAVSGLEAALAGRECLVLGVGRDHLMDGERDLGDAVPAIGSLARLLHELDLAAMEFRAGVQAPEIERLVSLLGRARREQIKGQRLADALALEPIEHVRLGPIDYRGLSITEGVGDQPDPQREAGGDPWARLARVLTDPAAYDGPRIEELAREIGAEIESREGAGIGGLRRQIGAVLQRLPHLPEGQRQTLRKRLGSFVSEMKPSLRADLLRIGPGPRDESYRLLNELSDTVPLPEVLDALRDVEQAGSRVSDEVIALLNKLVDLSDDVASGEARPPSTPLLQRAVWGDEITQTRQAVGELLQRRHAKDYNPGEYRALLAGLARRRRNGSGVPASAALYRDPADVDDVRLHAGQIAVRLLGRADGERHRRALLQYVGAETDFIVQREAFETVHQATLAARAHALLKSESDDTRRAARGFLDSFGEQERIDVILSHACRGQGVPAAALDLLGLGGARALDAVLDMLRSTDAPGIGAALRRFARERGADLLGRVLDERLSRGKEALEPVFAVLYELPTSDAVPLLKRLYKHDDYRVRHQALAVLLEIDRRASAPERYIRRGLRDPHPRVVSMAVRRAAEREGCETTELLGAFVEGSLDGAGHRPAMAQRAAEVLAGRDDAARERLALSLVRLTRTPRLASARLAREVAALLSPHRGLVTVRRSLAYWRYSISRLAGLFAPRRPRTTWTGDDR